MPKMTRSAARRKEKLSRKINKSNVKENIKEHSDSLKDKKR